MNTALYRTAHLIARPDTLGVAGSSPVYSAKSVNDIPMGVPPESAMFVRGAEEMFGLLGGRCVDYCTISTPPSIHPHCINCGGPKLEPVAVALRGQVHTFVVNHTMPLPFAAPLPIAVLDMDDGSRSSCCKRSVTGATSKSGAGSSWCYGSTRTSACTGIRLQGPRQDHEGNVMSWNRVAVVGAGLIKMGELFEQSYEQMAVGAFEAAVASVDKGFEPRQVEAAFVALSVARCGDKKASVATRFRA